MQDSTTMGDGHDDVTALLLAHCDRVADGRIEDPAVLAAVVGVERVACAANTTDADALRRLIADREAAGPDLGWVLDDVAGQVRAAQADTTRATPDAAAVNLEAGHHVIARDAVLLRAAVRAGHRSWVAAPYYAIRYGTRGLRFTTSDSAWLAGLVGAGQQVVDQQVGWLSRVLAARGMPTWLLQSHLEVLVEEVRAAAPTQDPTTLAATARGMAERRRGVVDDHLLTDLAAAAWPIPTEAAVPQVGALVAAAHADAVTGVVADDLPVTGWLVQRDPAWRDVVDDVRRRVGG